MLPNGRYSAWFRIPSNEGMGVITLADGKLTGGDTVIAYSGDYVQDGDEFSATISTHRHSAGQPGIFGIDDLKIDVVGTSKAATATCKGRVKQRPDVPFEVVLVRIND